MFKMILLRISRIFFAAIFVLGMIPVADSQEWKEYRTQHFLIYYKDTPQDFIRTVEDAAERYYDEILDRLGFSRETIWTLKDRTRIYIYSDQEDYVNSTGQAGWSHGAADVRNRIIKTFPSSNGFFDTLLPHELGHIIFREYIGYNLFIPLWFEEGIAMFQEKAKRWGANKSVHGAIKNGKFIPLTDLSRRGPTKTSDDEYVNLYYTEAASLVYYMIVEFGKYRFNDLCRKLKNGDPFEDAVLKTYRRFQSMEELNEAWMEYVKEH
ncbi:MAG: peptidase MA family metallohydrolase [Candidatus Omnitrophica bacterium]|nr:peptidase MA family metallohydrolase [Candidatus Omnitrophota bacterium]